MDQTLRDYVYSIIDDVKNNNALVENVSVNTIMDSFKDGSIYQDITISIRRYSKPEYIPWWELKQFGGWR
jgi:hypothetical protein